MPVESRYLGWAESVAGSVGDYLMAGRDRNPTDLSDTIVLVPTRQSGRRLRVALACRAESAGLLAPRVITPKSAFREFDRTARWPADMLVEAVWTKLLLGIDRNDYPALFPQPPASGEVAWAYSMGCRIDRLRRDLAAGGLGVGSALEEHADRIEEFERWRDLARLEQLHIAELERSGYGDRSSLEIAAARNPSADPKIRRMIVAAVADLSPLMVELLANLADSMPVEVLVHAPEDMRSRFDRWGRPKVRDWRDAIVEIPDTERNLLSAADPYEQADRVLELIAAESARFGLDDVALGVPDTSVADLAGLRLADAGLATFDPSGESLGDSPICLLLECFADMAGEGTFAALRRFLGQPAILGAMTRLGLGSPRAILAEADRFSEAHLPVTIDDVATLLSRNASDYPALMQAVVRVRDWVARSGTERLSDFLPGWLAEVYSGNSLPEGDGDRDAALEIVNLLSEALESLETVGFGAGREQMLRFIIQHLRTCKTSPRRAGPAIDMQGWMELLWEDAPLLVVTGMNEGFVPESEVGDIFLPDTLRTGLGLPDDAAKLARDIYYLQSICASRSAAGRAVFISGRTAANGDPLKPSRLFFNCRAEELVRRAMRLFRSPGVHAANLEPEIGLLLDPSEAVGKSGWKLPDHLSPSAISDYLQCPFRFYLKRIAGLRKCDPGKAEMDALDYGNLIHHALEQMGNAGDRSIFNSPKALADFLEEICRQRATFQFGAAISGAVAIQTETAVRRLRALADEQIELMEAGWETVAVELSARVAIAGIEVRGRIDRVDRNADRNLVRLIDYKTSDKAISPHAYHLAAVRDDPEYALCGKKAWSNLQLPLYRMLVSSELVAGSEVELALFNLPKATSETGIAVWTEFNRDAKIFESARRCAEGAIADIRAGRFWPPRGKVEYDDYESLFPQGLDGHIDSEALSALLKGGGDE